MRMSFSVRVYIGIPDKGEPGTALDMTEQNLI